MLSVPLRWVLAQLVATTLAAAAPQATGRLTPDQVGRALAGEVVAPLAADGEKAALIEKHGERMARYWASWEEKLGESLAAWAREAIAPAPDGTVFYPFSGPDFATAHRIWPDATRYVFVAYQRAGRIPALGRLPLRDVAESLGLFREGLRSFASLGFFVTTTMNERFGRWGDADEVGVEGITGILILFAVLEGFEVERVEPIRVARDRVALETHPGDRRKRSTWSSVRLHLRRPTPDGLGQPVLLDYVRIDLLDRKLVDRPHHERWLVQAARHPTLLKSASHLLQRPSFSFVRDTLLAEAPAILQDESGLPYDRLASAFDVRLFGHFDRFHEKFQGKTSAAALRAAYDDPDVVEPLPFRIGYDKRHASCLQYAYRRREKRAEAP